MWLRFFPFLAATLALGCDKSEIGPIYPVRGTIRLNGEPLAAKSAAVLFKPDTARGNTSAFEPSGTVDEAGQYQLMTQGKHGAPPGWYKVIVAAYNSSPEHRKSARPGRPVVTSVVPAKYGRAETTPLSIEVVAEAASDAYELKLSK
jgi:hypothetical protein